MASGQSGSSSSRKTRFVLPDTPPLRYKTMKNEEPTKVTPIPSKPQEQASSQAPKPAKDVQWKAYSSTPQRSQPSLPDSKPQVKKYTNKYGIEIEEDGTSASPFYKVCLARRAAFGEGNLTETAGPVNPENPLPRPPATLIPSDKVGTGTTARSPSFQPLRTLVTVSDRDRTGVGSSTSTENSPHPPPTFQNRRVPSLPLRPPIDYPSSKNLGLRGGSECKESESLISVRGKKVPFHTGHLGSVDVDECHPRKNSFMNLSPTSKPPNRLNVLACLVAGDSAKINIKEEMDMTPRPQPITIKPLVYEPVPMAVLLSKKKDESDEFFVHVADKIQEMKDGLSELRGLLAANFLQTAKDAHHQFFLGLIQEKEKILQQVKIVFEETRRRVQRRKTDKKKEQEVLLKRMQEFARRSLQVL